MQDFVLATVYVGGTFLQQGSAPTNPASGAFRWGDMNDAIWTLQISEYFSKLHQYGIGKLAGSVSDLVPPQPPVEWFQPEHGFRDRDVEILLAQEIDAGRLPTPTAWPGRRPVYMAVMRQGMFPADHLGSDHTATAVGLHWHFDYRGMNVICAWALQGDSLNDTMKIVTHELVEACGSEVGAGELCDDCVSQTGVVRGVTVQAYKSREDGNICVIPGEDSPIRIHHRPDVSLNP